MWQRERPRGSAAAPETSPRLCCSAAAAAAAAPAAAAGGAAAAAAEPAADSALQVAVAPAPEIVPGRVLTLPKSSRKTNPYT